MADNLQQLMQFALDRAFATRLPNGKTRPGARATLAELRQALCLPLPERGDQADVVINKLVQAATPGLMGNTGGDFYGWVMGASSDAGMMADLLTTVWGQNSAIYQTAPGAAIAEEAAANWLLELLDLPRESSVGFVTGATMASFVALTAARDEVLSSSGWNIRERGLQSAPEIKVFLGAEAHISIFSVLRFLGLGNDQLVRVKVDLQGRMQADDLQQKLHDSNALKIIVAQAGHINSGAFDPLNEIAIMARQHQAWLHIDGAFGLWCRSSNKYKNLAAGAELADSWAVDGHKWLQVPYDSGYVIVRNAEAHRRAMAVEASYLNHRPSDGRNPSHYGPELSRRARGFSTWACLQSLGRQGVSSIIETHCRFAGKLASYLDQEPGIEVLNKVVLNQIAVNFSHIDNPNSITEADSLTEQVINKLQQSNRVFVSGAEWRGRKIMRISIISGRTENANIKKLAEDICQAWRTVRTATE